MRRPISVAIVLLLVGATSLLAQNRPLRRGGAVDGGVAPAEIQRLFDAYVVMQAQQELQLTDAQYPTFLSRMRALQSARQRGQLERARVLRELRRLSDAATLDEAQARAQLKALAEVDARVDAEVREALAGVDQVLDLRQQVRFRLFEEQMERRKVELLMRARQANRPREQP